jgi:hypothetical protein
MYYEQYNFLNNFYLDIRHLVSVFITAGGKICLLHIDVTKQTVRRYLLYNCKQKTCKKFLYYDSFTSKNPIQHTHTFVDQADFMSSCRTKSYRVVLKNRNGQILTKPFPENKLYIYIHQAPCIMPNIYLVKSIGTDYLSTLYFYCVL